MSGRVAVFFAILSLATSEAITNILERDVVILGGGASGAHAAVRLREDFNKTIVVIEKKDRLGGHVSTFTDPETGNPYDFGVNSYTDYGAARDFFARLDIPVAAPQRQALITTYADFHTGGVTNYSLPASADTTAALEVYLELCEKYESSIIPSYENFPTVPEGIPEDLTMNFSDFVEKYKIQAAVPRIYQVSALGMENFSELPTLYVMQGFGAPVTRSFLGIVSSFVPVSRRNQDLYDAIASLLGNDVLYSTTAIRTSRTDEGVEVLVHGADGKRSLIRAKKLLISFEPTIANLNGIDIDKEEMDLFSKWDWSTVYVGVISHKSLPKGYSLTNNVPKDWLSFPTIPFVSRIDYLGDNDFRVLVTGPTDFDTCQAQLLIRNSLASLAAAAGTIPSLGTEEIDFKAWSDHGPMHIHVSSSELKAGHITKQYALQGRKSTYYTGAAWSVQFTTILWEYNNQYALPKLLADF
ncbi:amine oxidase [Colletotrichum graminicola M1.001]|uniref:Amine oxidase n=1 Tax=Colletotrichum graminicola (strain M1.001 / M2 / FGSC 10212) TaxID=645133 RepID=E3Q9F1_COLGM|nr:amine oxidase [Colletotrichum graminicola M1.001]EFQ27330.1 amine oxidase [Colletotrichum graminicola M1.001]